MRFQGLYRISFYAMLTLAALTLNIDAASDFPPAPLYPIAVGAACVLAFLTVDRDPTRGLPPGLARFLAVGSVGLSIAEYAWDPNLLVLAMGHWLIYLTLIKILLPKTVEDDWFLYLLGLTQVVVGAFLPGQNVGFVLVLWAITALWTLGLFHLQREAAPSQTDADATVSPAPDPREPYPGLIDGPFVLSGLNVALLTLALGGLIFLLMPRWGIATRPRGQSPGLSQNLTGFTDTVQLGQMGQILESEAVVMSIELYDEDDNRLRPGLDSYWRGVVMQRYERGRWYRQQVDPVDLRSALVAGPLPQRYFRQEIKLEPTSGEALFAMRPVLRASGSSLMFNPLNGVIFRDVRGPRAMRGLRNRTVQFDYSLISGIQPDAPQPGERYPRNREIFGALLEIPEDPTLRSTLARIVREVTADIPVEQIADRARALEAYLRDSGQFSYTLRMDVIDRSIDPIADFLINRKEGHCEYYASALTMLLRAAGIPSRMINGFKGGDWNDLGEVLVVRQKHAHSWVEALVDHKEVEDRRLPIWLTLDGTPELQREETVAQVGGLARHFRFVSDYLRYLWIFYVVGFNEQRQEQMIYGPIRALAEEARHGFRVMGDWLARLSGGLLDFPDLRSFFSVRGFVVSVVTLLLLLGCWHALRWSFRRLFPGRRSAADEAELASGLASYRRLVRLLADLGLQRTPAETPREFAHRSVDVLATRGPDVAALAGIPGTVVEVFYGIRFGARPLAPDEAQRLESRLDALEASLRPPDHK